MAASFTTTKYLSDAGGVYNIRVADASITAFGNTVPPDAITDANVDVSVGNHGQRKKPGINARGFVLERFTGVGAARKRYTTFLPILTPSVYDDFQKGEAVTIGTVEWKAAYQVAEV